MEVIPKKLRVESLLKEEKGNHNKNEMLLINSNTQRKTKDKLNVHIAIS